jgi:hypothetical protein
VDPSFILVLLLLMTATPAAIVAGCRVVPEPCGSSSAREMERALWRSIWRPLAPALAVAGVMVGWAIAEPVPADEPVSSLAVAIALPFAVVWGRALGRAASSLGKGGPQPLAATVGLLRPTVVLSPALESALDPEALAAVRAHERAHASHRDPLRIWLAQLATDLQWPSPAAALRLRAWRRTLEMARDEEVRQAGTEGPDLAAGILDAIRFMKTVSGVAAALIDEESSLRERITRLLGPLPDVPEPRTSFLTPGFVCAGVAAAVLAGIAFGDPIVAALLNALA